RFAFVLALSLAGAASLARAEFPIHLVRTPGGVMCVAPSTCSHPTDCTTPDSCMTVMNSGGMTSSVCLRDTATEIFCCATALDCPSAGTSVRCVRSVMSGSAFGLCAYGDRSYCLVDPTMLGVGEEQRFIACHTPAIDPCRGPVTTTLTDFDN